MKVKKLILSRSSGIFHPGRFITSRNDNWLYLKRWGGSDLNRVHYLSANNAVCSCEEWKECSWHSCSLSCLTFQWEPPFVLFFFSFSHINPPWKFQLSWLEGEIPVECAQRVLLDKGGKWNNLLHIKSCSHWKKKPLAWCNILIC